MVTELIEDLVPVLKISCGVDLGITWHERISKLSADQKLDFMNVVALSLRR